MAMENQGPKPASKTAGGEAMPFFSKHGHLVLATLILSLVVNLLLRSWRRGEQFTRRTPLDNQRITLEPTVSTTLSTNAASLELSPHEEFNEYGESQEAVAEPYLPKDLEHVMYEYNRPSEQELLKRSLEFYRIVNARRTLRFFSPDPVPRDVIHNIIRAAGTSPSGAHTEPWTFVVVSEMGVKAYIREVVEREEEVNYTKRMGKKWTADLRPLRTDWRKQYLTEAPYLILVFKQDYALLPNGTRKIHYYKEMSIAIACGILITAIQYVGLVTLTSTPLNCGPQLRVLLNRPVNEKLVLLLPVGYPAKDATVPALHRKPLEDILVEFQ